METQTKAYFFLILGVLILLVSSSIFFISKSSSISPSENSLEECKPIHLGQQGAIGTVFFAPMEEAEKYTSFFLNARPFNENKESFSFYYIDTYSPKCEIYKGIATLCHSRDLIEKAASCPNSHIVVLKDEKNEIRSSSYLSVMSLNSNHLLTVYLHEFGHNFANLAEEYLNNQNPPRGSKNCVSECSDFEFNTDGCFQECSQSNLQRSVQSGVMRTLSPADKENPYGTFNSALLESIINKKSGSNKGVTGNAISGMQDCEKESYVLYSNGELLIRKGCTGSNGNGDSEFVIKKDGAEIYSEEFSEKIWTDFQLEESEILEGETYYNPEVDLTLTFSSSFINKGADSLEIYDESGILKETINLEGAGASPCEV